MLGGVTGLKHLDYGRGRDDELVYWAEIAHRLLQSTSLFPVCIEFTRDFGMLYSSGELEAERYRPKEP